MNRQNYLHFMIFVVILTPIIGTPLIFQDWGVTSPRNLPQSSSIESLIRTPDGFILNLSDDSYPRSIILLEPTFTGGWHYYSINFSLRFVSQYADSANFSFSIRYSFDNKTENGISLDSTRYYMQDNEYNTIYSGILALESAQTGYYYFFIRSDNNSVYTYLTPETEFYYTSSIPPTLWGFPYGIFLYGGILGPFLVFFFKRAKKYTQLELKPRNDQTTKIESDFKSAKIILNVIAALILYIEIFANAWKSLVFYYL
jgi:hypothetical protein